MSSTRGRNGSSVSNFGLQDFGALSAADLRDNSAIRLVAPTNAEHLAVQSHEHQEAVSHAQPIDVARAPSHTAAALDIVRHAHQTHVNGNGHVIHSDASSDQHFVSLDHAQSILAPNHLPVSEASAAASSFSPAPISSASFDQTDVTLHTGTHSRQGDAGHGVGAGSDGAHADAPPPAVPVAGQLWAAFGGPGAGGGNPDGHTDFRIEHADSDNASSNSSVTEEEEGAGGSFVAVGLDTSAGISISLDSESNGFHLRITNINTGIDLSSTVIASVADQDTVNAMVVDPIHNTIYMDLDGYDYLTHGGDIIKITYNQTTGAISNPYTWNDTTKTGSVDTHGILVDSTSSGGLYQDGRAFVLSHDGSTLYYVDDDNNNTTSVGGPFTAATNGIYRISTTGDVGDGNAPTPVQLSSSANTLGGFPTNDSLGYITGLAVNEAQGIIYFTTAASAPGINTSEDALWWMPIAGGLATKMTIPGGVALDFPVFYGEGMAFDIKSRMLYYSDSQTGEIVQFTLSADGKSFSSATNFALFDSNGGTSHDGAYANDLVFDDLPTLASLSATTTEAVQGGSAITLLTALPSITDTDNVDLNHFSITIQNAQSGDNLFCNGAQSGTMSGVTISWNSSTHTLTLSGDVSFATYQSLLQQISYQDSGIDNSTGSHPTRTILWVASDGVTDVHASAADSNEQTTTVVIDRAPTLTADSYLNILEGSTTTKTSGTGVLSNDTDKDADAIIVTAVNGSGTNVNNSTPGTYGHLTLHSDGSFTYLADMTSNIDGAAFGSHPVDTFTYTVSDGLGGVTTSTVSFTIDRAPTLTADAPAGQALESGSPITGNVLTNDTDHDGDSLTVTAVNGSGTNLNASVAGTYGHIIIHGDGSYTYSADITSAIDSGATGSHLTDTFTYTADDGHGGTTTTTITVIVDRAPTVVSDSSSSDAVESGAHSTGNVLTNDSDRDGDSLVVSAVNGSGVGVNNSVSGTYGHITIHTDGSYDYTADMTSAIDSAPTGSHLTDTFSYTASDGHGGTTTTNIVITLDRAPTVVNDSYSGQVTEGDTTGLVNGTSGVLNNDSDRDGDSLTVLSVLGSNGNVNNSTATTYGHITLNSDGSYTYVADNTSAIDGAPTGSHPTDVVTFVVSDGFGGMTTETLSITIDRLAVANADTINTNEPGPAQSGSGGNPNLLANDVDKDGDAITITQVNGSAANVGVQITTADGALVTVHADGTYTYDTNHVFDYLAAVGSGASDTSATDSFTYQIDGGSFVTVTINISGVDSNDTLIGTSGADTINGGIGDNIFYDDDGQMSGTDPHDTSAGHSGGADTLIAGSGSDSFYMGANLTAAVSIDGGGGIDHVYLNGDYSAGVTFSSTTMVNVEFIQFAAGHDYKIITDDATVGSGQLLTVQGGFLGAGDSLYFDGSAETNGHFTIQGGAGDDTMIGGSGNDIFRPGAGNDTVKGGGGSDSINFGANFTAADSVDGGAGNDELFLNGNYSTALVFSATTMINVESIGLAAGNSYNLVMNNATVASGQTLTIRAGTLLAGDALTFDGSADTSGGNFVINSGAGNDVITGGWTDDVIRTGSGNDTVHAGGGNDSINVGAFLTAADTLDGGAGSDTLYLNGDYSAQVTFGSTTISNIESIVMAAGHSYNFILNGLNVADGSTLTVHADTLGASDSLTFDGSALDANTTLYVKAGDGDDTVMGGGGNDTIIAGNGTNVLTGNGGADQLYGGSGVDTFVYTQASDSTSSNFDRIHGFDASMDKIDLRGYFLNAIDTEVSSGHLTSQNFDANLSAAIGSAQLAAHDAVLFTPDTGNLHGHTFLIVDLNGVAGYQAGQDIVIDITGASNLGSFSTADFIFT
jgi:VCBS repeat-containing protein